MFNLLAGAFASMGMIFGSLFGGHASTTPMHAHMSSTTPMHSHMASSTWATGHMGSTTPMQRMAGMFAGKGVMGVVTGVNGSTLTVSGKDAVGSATTTYSVNASSAKVIKNAATSTLASVAVGDHILVQGTINGTSVTAALLIDGLQGMGKMAEGMMHMGPGPMRLGPGSMHMGQGSSTPGQPPLHQ
jgi:hypothetical protein